MLVVAVAVVVAVTVVITVAVDAVAVVVNRLMTPSDLRKVVEFQYQSGASQSPSLQITSGLYAVTISFSSGNVFLVTKSFVWNPFFLS